MFAAMSVSSPTGSVMADGWPSARGMAGLTAVPMSHAIDLAHLFPVEMQAHEALMAETRRHLGGCLTAIETALRLSAEGDLASALTHHPDPLCWPMVRAHPELIGPELLAHMQMRAGMSLMLRQFGRPDGERPDVTEAAALLPDDDAELAALASDLTLAEARWSAIGGDDAAMQPDLPAEYFAELLWTAVACLTTALARSTLVGEDVLIAALDRAGQRLLARYDESAGPLATADRLVLRLGARADEPELLGRALAQRRFPLFAALAARRVRLPTDLVTGLLLTGAMEQVAALCCSLGGAASDYRHLLLSLRSVRPALTDARIVAEADHYASLDEAEADRLIGLLRAPIALRVKLDHLRRVARP